MTLRVSDGEREGYGPSQTGKHQHVLKTKLYLRGSAEVEQEREDVDVDDSTSKNGHLIVSYMFRQGYILHTGLNHLEQCQSKCDSNLWEKNLRVHATFST